MAGEATGSAVNAEPIYDQRTHGPEAQFYRPCDADGKPQPRTEAELRALLNEVADWQNIIWGG